MDVVTTCLNYTPGTHNMAMTVQLGFNIFKYNMLYSELCPSLESPCFIHWRRNINFENSFTQGFLCNQAHCRKMRKRVVTLCKYKIRQPIGSGRWNVPEHVLFRQMVHVLTALYRHLPHFGCQSCCVLPTVSLSVSILHLSLWDVLVVAIHTSCYHVAWQLVACCHVS